MRKTFRLVTPQERYSGALISHSSNPLHGPFRFLRRRPRRLKDKRSSDLRVPSAGHEPRRSSTTVSGTEWPSTSFMHVDEGGRQWTGTGSKEIGSK